MMIDLSHQELTVISDILRRVHGLDDMATRHDSAKAITVFTCHPAFTTALEKIDSAALATRPGQPTYS
jgi:hypothetical protein